MAIKLALAILSISFKVNLFSELLKDAEDVDLPLLTQQELRCALGSRLTYPIVRTTFKTENPYT